ncbi:MAG: methionine ABC transporter ATP-binding protein [Janthinobacterium lividum]
MSAASAILSRLAVTSEAGSVIAADRASAKLAGSGGAAGTVAFRGVSKSYSSPAGTVEALSSIDTEVTAGSVFGIIGRSGAGKSTLLRLVNRLERPTAGVVLVEGEDIGALDEKGLVALRRRVGMIFQHFNLISAKTVWGNVALPLLVAGVKRPEIERRVAEALALVGLEDKRDSFPSRLSGGQKQRVGIARALVSRPRILLCDEATSALDPEATLSILGLLKDINRRLGLTIVLITHEMAVVREICDRVLVLQGGQAVETGKVWRVFGEAAHPATRALLRPVGAQLPEDLRARLLEAPRPGRRDPALIELRFVGQQAPDLSRLAAVLEQPLHLLDGALDRIAGHSQGRLLVSTPLDAGGLPASLAALADHVEVLGYVAADD